MNLFFNRAYTKEIIASFILFLLAFTVRVTYQNASQVNFPFRGDSGEYFITAYNFLTHGSYSLEFPNDDGTPPQTTTDLSPGLPLLITFFFKSDSTIESVFQSVTKFQTVLGSFTVVFTFILARLSIGFSGALLAGILTALSPHLISTESYVLTETLYTFVLMMGSLFFTIGWLRNLPLLTGISGLILAFSAQVRTVSVFLLWFFSPLLAVSPKKRSFSSSKTTVFHILSLLIGFMIIATCYHQFKGYAITRDSWLREHIQQSIETETDTKGTKYHVSIPYMNIHRQLSLFYYPVTPRNSYQHIGNPLKYIKLGLTPPEFYIHDFRFDNKREETRYKRKNKALTNEPFNKYPLKYITWNLWGKYFSFWNWNILYTGDIYIYEMIQTGFEVNIFLKIIYDLMHSLHIPLYLLSLCGVILFFVHWAKAQGIFREQTLAIPVFGFLYFHAICTLAAWLPRYSIPVRPFSYILVAATLTWAVRYSRDRALEHNAAQQTESQKDS